MGDPADGVAVVGYGPAGAVAAALLGQAGHRVFVAERLRGAGLTACARRTTPRGDEPCNDATS